MLTIDAAIQPVDANGIPRSMAEVRRWLCWKATPQKRKDGTQYLDKQPRKPSDPNFNASTTKPETWGTFGLAVQAHQRGDADGVGFCLCEGWLGVDLDNVRNPVTGEMVPAAQAIIEKLDTYTEVSPSLTGVKMFLLGSVPQSRKRPADGIDVEIYGTETLTGARYFTVTGLHVAGTPTEVAVADEPRMAEVMRLWVQMVKPTKPMPERTPRPMTTAVVCDGYVPTDSEVVETAAKVCKGFRALWNGDSSRHGGDDSAADQGLANHLAWLCGPNGNDQVRRLMIASGRKRDKFETHKTYLDRTIAKAYEGATEFYTWKHQDIMTGGTDHAGLVPRAAETPATQTKVDDGAANVASPRTWNDTGMALRIVRESRGTIRYVVDRGIWVRWTGKHWEDDSAAAEAQRIAKAVGSKLWDEMHAAGRGIPVPGVRFVMNAANRRAIDAAIALAKSEPPVEVRSAAFDTDPDVLNVANGILDLRTRGLRAHDPAAMLTKLAGVNYEPAATCPKWLAFIDAVTCGDKLLAGFLQRSFGLAMSADQSEQRLWIHHGEGSNGKGTALAVLHRVFGTYAGPAPVEILLARRQDGDREIGVAKLAGKRLAFAQEADDGVRLSEATVKALTGSDPLTGRFLYQNNFEVMPTWHLHLAVNDRPSIRGTDHGIWRRVTLVPWLHTFTDAEKRPRAVVEGELLAEGPGILNWLLDGYESWRAHGLRPPPAVDAATSEYRSESDSVRAWIADACTVEAGAETPATDLFVNYRDWCRRAGDRGVSQTKFGRTLDALGHGKELPRSGAYRDRTVRMGLRIVHRHEEVDGEPAYLSPMDARF